MSSRQLLGLFLFGLADTVLAVGLFIQFPTEPIWAIGALAAGLALIAAVVWG